MAVQFFTGTALAPALAPALASQSDDKDSGFLRRSEETSEEFEYTDEDDGAKGEKK